MWVKLRSIKVGERNPTKEQYCVVLLVRGAQSGSVYRDRKSNGGDRGLEEELVFSGTELLFVAMKMFWKSWWWLHTTECPERRT